MLLSPVRNEREHAGLEPIDSQRGKRWNEIEQQYPQASTGIFRQWRFVCYFLHSIDSSYQARRTSHCCGALESTLGVRRTSTLTFLRRKSERTNPERQSAAPKILIIVSEDDRSGRRFIESLVNRSPTSLDHYEQQVERTSTYPSPSFDAINKTTGLI